MKYNTITRQAAATVPAGIYEGIDYHGEPPADVAARAGWVDVTPEIQAEIDAAEAEAATAAAAAEAIRLATPIRYDQPIQARLETPADDGHIYGLEVDPDSGELYPVQRESQRKTDAEYAAAKADAKAARAAHRANMQAIKTDLDQVETALDQIDVSASSSYATNIAACTGATKTALQDTRKVLVDVKAALKNLRQAAEKVRKEIR
jgi:hypothetical protein